MSDHPDDDGSPARDATHGSRLVAAGILLSRLSGFVRERAFAHFFGTSDTAGAYKAAFRIPNLLQNLLGEGVLSASFIPVHARLLAEGRREEAGRVAGAVAGLLLVAVSVLVLLVVVLAEPLVALITLRGFSPELQDLTVRLLRIIAPGTGVLVLSAWCLGVLNSHRRFFLSYVAPVLWNVAQVAVLVVAGGYLLGSLGPADSPGRVDLVTLLAAGTVVGALLQLLVQLPGVLREEPELRLSLDTRLAGVRTAARSFLPVVAGRGVVQIGALLDLTLAGLLDRPGPAVAALAAAQTLFVLPVSLFGMSVAAAELPELSRADQSDVDGIAERLRRGSRRIAFYVAPTTVVFVLQGDLVVGALYRSGAFGRLEELQVWAVLAAFSVGLLATTATRLVQSVFYGLGDARTPAVVAGVRVAVGIVASLAVMFVLDDVAVSVGDGIGRPANLAGDTKLLGVVGIAVGSACAAWAEFWLLRRRLARVLERDLPLGGGLLGALAPALLAAAVVAAVAHWIVGDLPRLVGAPLGVGLTGLAYLVVAARGGVPEARALFSSVAARLDR